MAKVLRKDLVGVLRNPQAQLTGRTLRILITCLQCVLSRLAMRYGCQVTHEMHYVGVNQPHIVNRVM
jgi:hypothetical protein